MPPVSAAMASASAAYRTKRAGHLARSSAFASCTPPAGHASAASCGGSSACRQAKQSTPAARTRRRWARASSALGPGSAGWQCGYCPSMSLPSTSQLAQPRGWPSFVYADSNAKPSSSPAQLHGSALARWTSEVTLRPSTGVVRAAEHHRLNVARIAAPRGRAGREVAGDPLTEINSTKPPVLALLAPPPTPLPAVRGEGGSSSRPQAARDLQARASSVPLTRLLCSHILFTPRPPRLPHSACTHTLLVLLVTRTPRPRPRPRTPTLTGRGAPRARQLSPRCWQGCDAGRGPRALAARRSSA